MHGHKVMGAALIVLSVASGPARAESRPPERLATIEVVAAGEVAPTAASRIEVATTTRARPSLSASEVLGNVPGVSVRDRGNFAQDLQVQSRGFGSRASFGIRGLRLLLDDIPVSANDGQGQLANWPLAALDRIELLRGPLALSMGNAAGGVLAAYTLRPGVGSAQQLHAGSGTDGQVVVDVQAQHRAAADRPGFRFDAQSFRTDGDRPHAAARRHQVQLMLSSGEASERRWHAVANLLSMPEAEDPLGITPAQWHGGIRTDTNAERFDTRKSVRNAHVGAAWFGAPDDAFEPRAIVYATRRDVEQFLSVPVAAQSAPTSAGGVVDLGREGVGLIVSIGGVARALTWRVGAEFARTDENRRGFENFADDRLGVRGALRRDERNRIDSHDAFASLAMPLARGFEWSITARASDVTMRSRDLFLGNGDDSGRWHSDALNASTTLAHADDDADRCWLSLGSGFETPTLNELSYRPDALAGLNTALDAARSRMLELGTSRRVAGVRVEAALFDVLTRDDIVPAVNRAGRASFQNAERVRRRGAELYAQRRLARGLELQFAATWIDARFERGFSYRVPGENAPRVVADGARVPGVARLFGGADLEWRRADQGASLRLSLSGGGQIDADDRNTVAAPGQTRVDLGGTYRISRRVEAWSRVDNLFDRDAIGSVIVNEGNGRYFEPAAGRGFWVGLRVDLDG